MADPAKRRATYQDVLDSPEHTIAEIVNGDLRLSPRPGAPHTVAASQLLGVLAGPFNMGRGGPGGWIILFEPELHLGEDILVPDLAGWRRSRMPDVGEEAFFSLPPDWVCEVLSRSTQAVDRNEKLPIYAAAGVRHVWLIDARYRSVEVLRAHEGGWQTVAVHSGDVRVRAEPFDEVELDLGHVWSMLRPRRGGAAEETPAYEPG